MILKLKNILKKKKCIKKKCMKNKVLNYVKCCDTYVWKKNDMHEKITCMKNNMHKNYNT